ncbi:MAG: family acetyltransferase [Caulobacteraceae bacterium]|nr:family acetyltransferase [Caulobacteraceae bacterium]
MEIVRYRPDMAEAWNAFNRRARNGHFLFDRGFMDYHADRFTDASRMVAQDGHLIGLLPLNVSGDQAWSHQGLTFGGLLVDDLGAAEILAVLDACAEALQGEDVTSLTYKAQPWIYPSAPAQEDLYWLFRRDAALVRRDVSAAIDYRARGRVSSRRLRGARKGEKAGLSFGRSADWAGYWRLLDTVLGERHGAAAVHSLAEIQMLTERFPEEIALFTAAAGGELQAGVVMFRSDRVAHAQYIAAGEDGRRNGALDGLFEHLIALHATSHRYFDFGISNTDGGRVLNEGLMRQKEEFGASALTHDVYRLDL